MKKSNKLFGFCLFVFVLCCAFIVLSNKTYMKIINKDKTVYIEDLTEGDFVEAGSYITSSSDFKIGSGPSNLFDATRLCFSVKDDDKCDVADDTIVKLDESLSYLVPTIANYKGWMLKSVQWISSGGLYYLLFVPVNTYSGVTQAPSVDNNYTINGVCKDSSQKMTYAWYKVKDTEVNYGHYTSGTLSYVGSGQFEYSEKDGVHTFDNSSDDFSVGFNTIVAKDDIVMFDISFYNNQIGKDFYYKVTMSGQEVAGYATNRFFYNTNMISAKESGRVNIDFSFTEYKGGIAYGSFVRLKNLFVLESINNDAKLDTSNLSNGDKLLYVGSCGDSIVSRDTVSYVKGANTGTSDDDKVDSGNSGNNNGSNGNGYVTDDSNNGNNSGIDSDSSTDDVDKDVPNTGAFLSIGLIAILVFIGITIWNYADRKRKFNRM